MEKEAVYSAIKDLFITEFKLDPGSITPEKLLDEDLQLDSLDMVDLLINLRDYVDGEIDPALFKDATTVQDVVDLIYPLWK